MNQTKMFKMEGTVFTESEVRRKLAELGYHDVPKDQMKVFMQGEFFFAAYRKPCLASSIWSALVLVWVASAIYQSTSSHLTTI